MNSPTARLADLIKAKMAEQGKSTQGLSEATGISRPTLHRRLLGNNPFSVEELVLIATELGTTGADLLAISDKAAA